MGIFNADVIINIPPAFFSLQKSGLVRVYLTSVFLLLSVPRCFGDQKPQFDSRLGVHFGAWVQAWGRPMVGEAVPDTSEMVCAGRRDGCHVGEQRMDRTGPTGLQG